MPIHRKRFRIEEAFGGDMRIPESAGGEIGPMHHEIMAELRAIRAQMGGAKVGSAVAAVEDSTSREAAELRAVLETYRGDTSGIWSTAADGKELLAHVRALPGFGDQKPRIFVALWGKQLGVRPPGWDTAAGVYGETGSFRSVADIDSPEALAKVRQFKQAMKAEARAKLPNPG